MIFRLKSFKDDSKLRHLLIKENGMVIKFIHLFKTFIECLLCASHCAGHRATTVNKTWFLSSTPLVEKTKNYMAIIEISTVKEKFSTSPAFIQVSRMNTT